MTPGLSRIRRFLDDVGNPQESFKCVHIAGTNGKGSTAVLIAGMLKESGYRTALYTSPHLVDITERIKVDGKDISKKTFKKLSEKYLHLAQECHLSYFEYLTALAFVYFADKKIDIAVIETGLGGRFDATNIIKDPLACIITSIGFDHKEILGTALEKIAFEKAGIIKKCADIICGDLSKKALKVIKKKCEPLVFGKDFKASNIKFNKRKRGASFDYSGLCADIKNIKLSLAGRHQVQNASLAVCCAEILRKKGYKIYNGAIKRAFCCVSWPARFDIKEVKFKNKSFRLIIDGAHNEEGIKVFLDTLRYYYNKKLTFMFAAMKEKEYAKIIKSIAPYAGRVILVSLKNDRAAGISEISEEFRKYKKDEEIFTAGSVCEAFDILGNKESAVVAGSFYLAGEVLKKLNNKD